MPQFLFNLFFDLFPQHNMLSFMHRDDRMTHTSTWVIFSSSGHELSFILTFVCTKWLARVGVCSLALEYSKAKQFPCRSNQCISPPASSQDAHTQVKIADRRSWVVKKTQSEAIRCGFKSWLYQYLTMQCGWVWNTFLGLRVLTHKMQIHKTQLPLLLWW